MGKAIKDANRTKSLIAASSSDGKTPIAVYVDPTTHRLYVDVAAGAFVGSTLVIDGEEISASNTGVLLLGTDGANYQVLSVDSDGKLQVGLATMAGIGHGVKVVTTAGTDVALASSTPCKRVTIQAQTDNTNIIAVGGSGVDATIATGTGIVLYPGDVFEIDIDNLADIYIDSLVNGEGVRFTYFT